MKLFNKSNASKPTKKPTIKFKFDKSGLHLMKDSVNIFEWLILPGKTKRSPPRDSDTYLNSVK
jgi:hypothetical protein